MINTESHMYDKFPSCFPCLSCFSLRSGNFVQTSGKPKPIEDLHAMPSLKKHAI